MKKKYIAPMISTEVIMLEEGIASRSAFVKPQNSSGEIQEQWQEKEDQVKEFDWNNL